MKEPERQDRAGRECGAERDRRRFATVAEFARDVRAELTRHLAPAEVSLRGSFARGSHDEYSDVDLLAAVHRELDERFFSDLEVFLIGLYGPALVRYDPAHEKTTTSQHVRFSFYELPIFWRLDLDVVSDKEAAEKWPSPFPSWPVGTSALMNVVWAIKHHERRDAEKADHYLASACDKLGMEKLEHSTHNVLLVLDLLRSRADVDEPLLAKTRGAVEG